METSWHVKVFTIIMKFVLLVTSFSASLTQGMNSYSVYMSFEQSSKQEKPAPTHLVMSAEGTGSNLLFQCRPKRIYNVKL